ncbi:MAG: alpha-galactosidase [Eubacterium sp.]|nr:alpha-galactosidase [Eubacterium sp.]
MDFGIYYDATKKMFQLQLESSSYVMGLAADYLGHIFFGKKLSDFPSDSVLRLSDYTYMAGELKDKCTFMDGFPFEYGTSGIGDFRVSGLEVRNKEGFNGSELKYVSHEIYDGKKSLKGLPSTFEGDKEAKSLEIVLKDTCDLVQVTLIYTIFKGLDAVVKSVRVKNISENKEPVYLTKVMSSSVELTFKGHDVLTLHGSWARERIPDRRDLGHGKVSVSSERGISSHQEHPFMALVTPETNETCGEVIAEAFMYSGNFIAEVERTQHDALRMVMGINPYDFQWKLEAGEEFVAPEVLLVYSDKGFGGMSRTYHDLIREHVIRSPYLYKERPILINNWEATYFDFDMDKLLEIARQAKACGIEMLVMDDGWFGHRDSDNSSLGDWKPYFKKLPLGVKGLVEKVNEIGLDMGIWFEPEMVSPDSDLYRQHPDWAIAIPGRDAAWCRSQFVLDLTRPEVRDYVYESVASILRECNIKYVKWDMNRPLTDVGSLATAAGQIHHKYMLGVYELMDRLTTEFPDLLLENCSSGGARFDAGMFCYSPQIWCSDDTDGMERLSIQEGSSLIYPPSAIGAHVSICPNHIVGRTVDMRTRGYVALAGTFGYELDITKLSDQDKDIIKDQVGDYKKYSHLVREGDYYRITSVSRLCPANRDSRSVSWLFVSKDKTEALYTYVQKLGGANLRSEIVRLQGLDPDKVYGLDDGRRFTGSELMYNGFVTDKLYGDCVGSLYHFKAVD